MACGWVKGQVVLWMVAVCVDGCGWKKDERIDLGRCLNEEMDECIEFGGWVNG